MACMRVISRHCAAVSRGIKKRAIFCRRRSGRPRGIGEIGSARPCTRGRCSFRECFLIPMHARHAFIVARRENRARESLFPFLALRARRFLLTKNRILRSRVVSIIGLVALLSATLTFAAKLRAR